MRGGLQYQLQKLVVVNLRRDVVRCPHNVGSRHLGPTSWGRLLEFTFLRGHDVDTRRLHDQCMTSLRRLGDVEFFDGQQVGNKSL